MSGDVPLAARMFSPPAGTGTAPRVVVVTGSWLTVKEQMPDLYAQRLAERGYTALTFDFAGFGASGGALRQTEIPLRKIADLTAVTRFAHSIHGGSDGVGLVSICASAQYAVHALATGNLPVASFASVAGWFHDPIAIATFYGGAEGVADRLDRATRATRTYLETGQTPTVPAYAEGDDRAGMFIEMDYYANPQRGAVPTWVNEMTEITWSHWLTFDGLAAAYAIDTPSLFVHSDDAVFPDNIKTVASRLNGPSRLEWTDGAQIDFYDQPAQVDFAVQAIDDHVATTIGARR
ncbi:alpha/beta hydrolase [Micromonospora sp. DT81.3]